MKNKLHIGFMRTRTLLLLFAVLANGCLASWVFASEHDNLSNEAAQSNEQFETTRQSALSGSAESQFELGLLYEYGRGVDQDDLQAAYWYRKSAMQGYSDSQYRLAVLYDNGWGLPNNQKKAFDLYKSAALSGHTLAQYSVAIMYFQGSGVDKNTVQAYKWLTVADLGGSPLMQKHLLRVGQEMTSEEIKDAVFLARHWIENP